MRKDTNINLRVTEDQKAEMSEAASHAGIALSSWLVMIALREARKKAEG